MSVRGIDQRMAALTGRNDTFSLHFLEWLRALVRFVCLTVVPQNGVINVYLSPTEVTDNFTGGLGDSGAPWDGWAICDGNNGTPELIAFIGTPAGPGLVPLMRVTP